MTQCPSCGAGVEVVPGRCRKCGTSIAGPAAAPAFAVAGSGGSAAAAAPALVRGSAPPSFAGLSNYYQQEFSKIYNSNEQYKGTFNWAAFFFGPLWALTKGLYVAAIIAFVAAAATGGFLGLVAGAVFGARGNWFFYNLFVKGKQLPI